MRDQLKRLEELQQHDAKIQELENVLKAIPAKLEATRTDLLRVEALLRAEQSQLAETERYYGDQKNALDDELVHVKDPVAMAVMRQLKATLDPNGIMNPGKVV